MKNVLVALGILGTVATQSAFAFHVNPPGRAGGVGHGPYWHRNPAGPAGGAGRGWNWNPPGPGRVAFRNGGSSSFANFPSSVNPPGPVNGPGHGPYWHRNPVGPAGGPGSGWMWNPPGPGREYFASNQHINPPGAAGGPGHGPYWQHNPAGPAGGPGQGWNWNPPGRGEVFFQHQADNGVVATNSPPPI